MLHGAPASVTQACGRSGIAAFNAISGDEVLSRCGVSFEALSIMVDVQAFFAGDEHALDLELWGLWQVCLRARSESWQMLFFATASSCLVLLMLPVQSPSSRPQSAR